MRYDIRIRNQEDIDIIPWPNNHLKDALRYVYDLIYPIYDECELFCSSKDEGYFMISTLMMKKKRDSGMDEDDVKLLREELRDVLREIDPSLTRRGFVRARSNFFMSPPHLNAQNAIRGNKAERQLRECPDSKKALSTYFGKEIREVVPVPGHKKSDHIIIFEDDSRVNIQQKNGLGGGRGWSVDRRYFDKLPICDEAKKLLQRFCIDREGTYRPTVGFDPGLLLASLLLGDDESTKPDYFIHTITDDTGITHLSISSADDFVNTLMQDAYDHLLHKNKKTCVHLTPLVYLQRKGGGETDHSPDDIQAKLKQCPECMVTLI